MCGVCLWFSQSFSTYLACDWDRGILLYFSFDVYQTRTLLIFRSIWQIWLWIHSNIYCMLAFIYLLQFYLPLEISHPKTKRWTFLPTAITITIIKEYLRRTMWNINRFEGLRVIFKMYAKKDIKINRNWMKFYTKNRQKIKMATERKNKYTREKCVRKMAWNQKTTAKKNAKNCSFL